MAAMLCDVVVRRRRRRRRWAHAPVIHAASHFDHKKRVAWVSISMRKGKVSVHTSQVAHQAGAYPGFLSIKRQGVFLLPPGWDASPSQGYPPALNSPVPIYTPGWREAM